MTRTGFLVKTDVYLYISGQKKKTKNMEGKLELTCSILLYLCSNDWFLVCGPIRVSRPPAFKFVQKFDADYWKRTWSRISAKLTSKWTLNKLRKRDTTYNVCPLSTSSAYPPDNTTEYAPCCIFPEIPPIMPTCTPASWHSVLKQRQIGSENLHEDTHRSIHLDPGAKFSTCP